MTDLEADKRLRWQEFVAGLGAGLIGVTLTYPIHKIMFRQMLHGLPISSALDQLRKEGVQLLYRGLFPPLCQKAVSSSIMFGSYSYYRSTLKSSYSNLNTHLSVSLSASLAGCTEAVLSPFERIQTLLQDKNYNSRLHNTYHAVKHIWKHHGIREYYRGASLIVFRNAVSNVLFFSAKEKAMRALPKNDKVLTKYVVDFISGGVVGAAISTLFYPLNVVKARMQSCLGGPLQSPTDVLKTVWNERGSKITEMFRGVHLNYTRSLLSWGIINASYEVLRKFLYENSPYKD